MDNGTAVVEDVAAVDLDEAPADGPATCGVRDFIELRLERCDDDVPVFGVTVLSCN